MRLRDRCFSVGLKLKDPSLKKFFKGPSEKIFFLTLPGKIHPYPILVLLVECAVSAFRSKRSTAYNYTCCWKRWVVQEGGG